jgi:pimeloyl-ACP methyl ester carboxylesterase
MRNSTFDRQDYGASAARILLALLCTITSYLLIVAPAVAEDQFFDSDGVKIRYIDQGPRDGEPVVLIHGGFSNAEAWAESGAIDALDDTYRVIAPDLRGHGKSDKPHDPRQYGNAFIDDIIRLLDHLGIEKAHIVGYSMGGRITFKLVADHPERVISAMPNGTDGEPISTAMLAVMERVATSLEESGSIRPVLDHFNSDGSMTEEQIEQIVESIRATNDTKALAAVARSFPEFRPDRSKLEANPAPCLVVIGEHDPNRTALEKTAGYMANLEVEILDGVNHVTAYRDPALIAAIRAFVQKHAPALSEETHGDLPR